MHYPTNKRFYDLVFFYILCNRAQRYQRVQNMNHKILNNKPSTVDKNDYSSIARRRTKEGNRFRKWNILAVSDSHSEV